MDVLLTTGIGFAILSGDSFEGRGQYSRAFLLAVGLGTLLLTLAAGAAGLLYTGPWTSGDWFVALFALVPVGLFYVISFVVASVASGVRLDWRSPGWR